MKTSEFIKQVKAMGYGVDEYGLFLSITTAMQDFVAMVDKYTPLSLDTKITRSIPEDLFNIIVEYVRTPVKDREEPKLYTAKSRVVVNNGGYLSKRTGKEGYILSDGDSYLRPQIHFTQKELEDINGINIFTSNEWIIEEVAE